MKWQLLFKNNEIVKKNDRFNDVDLFQSMFSISCDMANDGSQYKIGLMPVCPNCGQEIWPHGVRPIHQNFLRKI